MERDLYELLQERDVFTDLLWEEFICVLRHSDYLLYSTKEVFIQTLAARSGTSSFNFDVKEVVIPLEDDDDRDLTFAKVFSREEGVSIVNSMFYKVEVIYYKKLQQLKGTELSWEKYIMSLIAKDTPWLTLVKAFRDALMRMDFKPKWCSTIF